MTGERPRLDSPRSCPVSLSRASRRLALLGGCLPRTHSPSLPTALARSLRTDTSALDSRAAQLFESAAARADEVRRRYRDDYFDLYAVTTSAEKRAAMADESEFASRLLWAGILCCPCTLGLSYAPYLCEARARRAEDAAAAASAAAHEARREAEEELQELKAKFLAGPTVQELERA